MRAIRIAAIIVPGVVFLVVVFWLYQGTITFLDRPFFLSSKKETIEVTYVSWGCNCANWIETKDLDSVNSNETFFIQAADSSIDVALDPAFDNNRYWPVRLTGKFYIDKGISNEYKTGSLEDKPDHARVFLYESREYVSQMLYDTSLVIHRQEFRIRTSRIPNYREILLVTRDKEIVLNDTLDQFSDITIADFNRDAFPDITLNFMGNVDTQSLYLYDSLEKDFNKINDFESYPQTESIQGSNEVLYYSYHRSGCADNAWTSDLFRIVNYKAILMGRISGNNCEAPYDLDIYKINSGEKTLLETLSYKLVDDADDKWRFIEKYWSGNYRRF